MAGISAEWLSELAGRNADLEMGPPASPAALGALAQSVRGVPAELEALLKLSNGLVCRSFELFPAFDSANPKKTWNSIQRANDASVTDALGGSEDLLDRFLVFADIGDGFAVFDRGDGSIWFEEGEAQELVQTDMELAEFIEEMVRNAV